MIAKTPMGDIVFSTQGFFTVAHFKAMANPCVIFIENTDSTTQATHALIQKMAEEVWRIEQKYSRYRPDSIISKINSANGQPTKLDEETYHLLQLSHALWQESQGMFDISSGIFRTLWHFDGKRKIPSQAQVKPVLEQVGWDKITYDEQQITLAPSMQIDFGGIGKEYAADRCASIAEPFTHHGVLVNLGGDIATKGTRSDNSAWSIGIESKHGHGDVWRQIPLSRGAVATSGDVYKSIIYQGKHYGHIINALSGYPVEHSPRTVTVAAPNCTEAGMLSTLAILQGENAEEFLQESRRPHWVQR